MTEMPKDPKAAKQLLWTLLACLAFWGVLFILYALWLRSLCLDLAVPKE